MSNHILHIEQCPESQLFLILSSQTFSNALGKNYASGDA